MNLLKIARGLLVAAAALVSFGAVAEVAVPPLTAQVTDQTGKIKPKTSCTIGIKAGWRHAW